MPVCCSFIFGAPTSPAALNFAPCPSAILTLSQLLIYPIKSLGGVAVAEAEVTAQGLRRDRRWLLVDAKRSQFLDPAPASELALLAHVAPAPQRLAAARTASAPELLPLYIPFRSTPKRTLFVTIWDDLVWAWRGRPAAPTPG
ncbi:MAG: MOSC N-terminal beta barrel domain-containing protein [Hymenobacter sp.]